MKAVPLTKGRGSARHIKAGPIEVSLGLSLFALSLSVSLHGPVGLMLAFGWNFHFVSLGSSLFALSLSLTLGMGPWV